MFDFIVEKKLFHYWFKRIGITNSWDVTRVVTNTKVATLNAQGEKPTVAPTADDFGAEEVEAVLDDFEKYRLCRPEIHIGGRASKDLLTKGNPTEEQIKLIREEIEKYIVACCYTSYESDDIAKKYATRALNWLNGTDFFTAPASTVYHDNVPGGLAKHTLKVIDKVIELSTIDTYAEVDLAQAILAAITHDWCKIDFYQPYMKNVKNEATGVWEKELAYKYKGSNLPFGHGVTSMFMAMKLFKLTTEQALAIRWHMNEYDVSDAQKHDLMDANEKYPMVTMLQTADRLAIL